MRYKELGYSIEAGIAKGRELPNWFKNAPEPYPGDEFYLKAFYDLSSCRDIGMSLGPIPWRDILTYAIYSKLDDDLIEPFIQIIREMDSGFLEVEAKKQEAKERQRS